MIRSGADVKMVQTIMSYSDIRKTMDRIGHLFPWSETVLYRATGCDENTSATNLPIPPGHKKTQLFKGCFLQKAGFQVKRLRWELNPRWRICNPQETNENIGNSDNPQQIQQQSELTPKNEATENDLLSIARMSLSTCRQDIERLLDSAPLDNKFRLRILRRVLTRLRHAEREFSISQVDELDLES
jgi:hypothetical protein